jgi:predicted ATP-grasp superfamily ATP-dependent carboligase
LRTGLNTTALVDHLLDVRRAMPDGRKVVLFPTSDRMVRSIADAWEALEPHYLLSWSHCRALVVTLQQKDNLARFAQRAGISYPASDVMNGSTDLERIMCMATLPLVVKPTRPLSSFKAIKVATRDELAAVACRFAADLPFVVQAWIEGGQDTLYACTTFLDRGHPLFLFPSHKLAASPPEVGQGTVFECCESAGLRDATRQFLRQFDLSGPVAVEFKKDPDGRYWLIEPNVGRTEYCVDLLIQSGINLPHLEYLYATGQGDRAQVPDYLIDRVWYDTDKDPLSFARYAGALLAGGKLRSPIFPFAGHADWKPVAVATWRLAVRGARAAARRLAFAMPRS